MYFMVLLMFFCLSIVFILSSILVLDVKRNTWNIIRTLN
jgi:hypothetical protein